MIVVCMKRIHGTSGAAKLGLLGGASSLMLACAALLMCSLAQAQTTYRTAEEAWRVGVAFISTRNFAANWGPLEAALQMAPDDKFPLRVYDALLPAYRQSAEADKFFDACDFLITKSPTPAQQTITRRVLLAFAFARGKLDELANRYEDALKKDPQNRTALYALSEP